ncbi:MAG: class I SAM-dependent methyltransferase [Candidatus Woesearchaeota archaeon]
MHMSKVILLKSEENIEPIVRKIHSRLEELLETRAPFKPNNVKTNTSNLLECYRSLLSEKEYGLGMAEIIIELTNISPDIKLDNISEFYSTINPYRPSSNEEKTLSVDEHVILAKRIWSKRSENFKKLNSISEYQIHINKIIKKMMIENENNKIPAIYFESWFRNNWGGDEISQIYRSVPNLSSEEQKVLWTFFGYTNPGIKRSYFSSEITEMRNKIDQIIQSSEKPIKILDIGCGPEGVMISEIKNNYKDKIELAAGIDIIIDKEIQNKPSNNFKLYEGTMNNLPFEGNNFDVVFSSYSLYFFDERGYSQGLLNPIISEALRVTNRHLIISGGTRFIQEELEKRSIKYEKHSDKAQTIIVDKFAF